VSFRQSGIAFQRRQESTVLTGSPIMRAKAEVPPKRSIICAEVINRDYNENREVCKSLFANSVIYGFGSIAQRKGVMTTGELLARLDEKGVKNAAIARALNVSPSRVTEMKKGVRRLQLDEAVKLVAAFELESPSSPAKVAPLPAPVARLVVLYIMAAMAEPAESRPSAEELAADIQAFSEFVTDPAARESIESAEVFFQALRLRRSIPGAEAPLGTDPQTAG
jgi:hypothetical protein